MTKKAAAEKKNPVRQRRKRSYGGQPYDRLWADMPSIAKLYKDASYLGWTTNRLAAIRATREIVSRSFIAQAYLTTARAEVVGDVCPMPTFSAVKGRDREALINMWKKWAYSPSTDGDESLTSIIRAALTSMLVDGRTFLLIKHHKSYPCGCAIQGISRDWLADQEVAGVKRKYPEGEAIDGVIRDPETGLKKYFVFYGKKQDTAEQLENEVFTLSKSFIGVSQQQMGSKVVIPAAQVLDLFCLRQQDDYNGDMSHIAPALDAIQSLTRLDHSLIQSSEHAATQGGFIKQSEKAPFLGEAIRDKRATEDEDKLTNPTDFPPNTEIFTLQRGSEFQKYEHAAPNGSITAFRESIEMCIAASLGVNANALTGDDRKASWSSLRAGEMRAKETWRVYQEAIKRKVLMPVLKAVIDSAIMNGDINISRKSYQAALMSDIRMKHFEFISPEEDMKAAMLQIQAGVLSPQALAQQLGRDYAQVMAEQKEAKKIAEELGLPFPPGAPSMPAQPKQDGGEMDAEDEDGDEPRKDAGSEE